VVKPEWGTKRTCQACGARFYDLRREPPACPKCGAEQTGKAAAKVRRPAAVPISKPPAPVYDAVESPVPEEDMEVAIEELDEEEAEASFDDEDEDAGSVSASESDDALIEDASELGEDNDDMSEVMEHVDDDLDEHT
jgi:uncharacterized protein (TIGR02300 family)